MLRAATHMDLPSHYIAGNKCIHDFDVNDLMTPCMVTDVVSKCHARYSLSVQDIADFEIKYGKILGS